MLLNLLNMVPALFNIRQVELEFGIIRPCGVALETSADERRTTYRGLRCDDLTNHSLFKRVSRGGDVADSSC